MNTQFGPLLAPMFALIILTAIVLLVSFSLRVRAVMRKEIHLNYFSTFTEGSPPLSVVKAQRHFTNLFEVPVLFYATCLAAMIVAPQNSIIVTWAWVFVAARGFHAIIHMTLNIIRLRGISYGLGWVALFSMWLQLLTT